MMHNRKLINILVYIVLISLAIFLIAKQISKPPPGLAVDELGRDHTTDIAGVIYNSDPPTSGPHFPMWAKKGVYDRLISDGYLIHSLEHGYVIISYDCTRPVISRWPLVVSQALAHDEPTEESTDSGELLKHMKLKQTEEMSAFTPESAPDIEVELPSDFKSETCKDLVTKLSGMVPKFERIIVIPRVGMPTPITLTAWNKLERFEKIDDKKILEFIKAYHNKGPEKTVEN